MVDGEDAFQKISVQKPDLIVLDVVMPKKNGFQVCRKLKNSPDTKGIKVVLLTSKSQDTDRMWGMRLGSDAYLSQPIDESSFLQTISSLI